MLKIDIDERTTRIQASGNLPEISSSLVIVVKELRNAFKSKEDRYVFDHFLKDVFIPLVFAEDNEDIVNILADSLKRAVTNEDERK